MRCERRIRVRASIVEWQAESVKQRSTKRIITTHAGSLPRPTDMIEMLVAKAEGKPVDEEAQRARLPGAVKEIVNKQIELGLDVIDDGEYSKPSFVTYVNDRLAGFEPDPSAPRLVVGVARRSGVSRLRLRDVRGQQGGSPEHRLGEVRGAG